MTTATTVTAQLEEDDLNALEAALNIQIERHQANTRAMRSGGAPVADRERLERRTNAIANLLRAVVDAKTHNRERITVEPDDASLLHDELSRMYVTRTSDEPAAARERAADATTGELVELVAEAN